jgi:hypothetical protein
VTGYLESPYLQFIGKSERELVAELGACRFFVFWKLGEHGR